MSFELPIDALLAQVGSERDEVEASEGDIGMAATGKEIMTETGPQPRTTRQFQNSFRGVLGQGGGTKRATEDAHEHQSAQALTMDFGQVAW